MENKGLGVNLTCVITEEKKEGKKEEGREWGKVQETYLLLIKY